jgi:predicted 3-demethylubiquinone-9 3-methyltransferase (glyoxalase superfamily)
MNIQKITPFLWFDKGAEEAAKYYTTVFKNSRIISTSPMLTILELEGLKLMLLNGGPIYKQTEAFSLYINCETQEEIDYFWDKLSEGGSEGRCGWLKDKYGVSWQVIPTLLGKLMSDPAKSQKVMEAFLKMTKFDISILENV